MRYFIAIGSLSSFSLSLSLLICLRTSTSYVLRKYRQAAKNAAHTLTYLACSHSLDSQFHKKRRYFLSSAHGPWALPAVPSITDCFKPQRHRTRSPLPPFVCRYFTKKYLLSHLAAVETSWRTRCPRGLPSPLPTEHPSKAQPSVVPRETVAMG